jgi:hypothetical protein
MTARAAVRPGPLLDAPIRGRTDIDVMVMTVNLIYREKILGVPGRRTPRVVSHNPSSTMAIVKSFFQFRNAGPYLCFDL